jgi:hypothetical protein
VRTKTALLPFMTFCRRLCIAESITHPPCKLHISRCESFLNHDLKYATNPSGAWVVETACNRDPGSDKSHWGKRFLPV